MYNQQTTQKSTTSCGLLTAGQPNHHGNILSNVPHHSEPSGGNEDTFTLLPQRYDLHAQVLHQCPCLICTSPLCSVAHRCFKRCVLEVYTFALKHATEVRVRVVEIQASISKPTCIPINHHQHTIIARELCHFLIDAWAQLLWNDADGVPDTCHHSRIIPELNAPASSGSALREFLFKQVVQLTCITLEVLRTSNFSCGGIGLAESNELLIEVDTNCSAELMFICANKFTSATSDLHH
mmetsp:Transcript_3423/g.6542  ORF Transcript_3423/g.6542 Transcript_3423/m.6542 type:complete len:238 (-) Transcript_3423:506-1219(-)